MYVRVEGYRDRSLHTYTYNSRGLCILSKCTYLRPDTLHKVTTGMVFQIEDRGSFLPTPGAARLASIKVTLHVMALYQMAPTESIMDYIIIMHATHRLDVAGDRYMCTCMRRHDKP